MSAVTAEVTKQMMQQWREQIHQSGHKESAEIDMIHAFNDLTAKVNGRVAFGTSHREVEEVIVLMREMQKLATAATLDAPILWYTHLVLVLLLFCIHLCMQHQQQSNFVFVCLGICQLGVIYTSDV